MTAYHRPETLSAALHMLAAGPMTVAAGCTDLFPATTAKSLSGAVLDVTGIPELSEIRKLDGGLRIGAAVTWSALIDAELPPAFDMLKQAAREIGSVQIQNMGTIAGNICNASAAADGIPCLLALDASVDITGLNGRRSVPLQDFVAGPRHIDLNPDELVSAITVPTASMQGTSRFLKLGARAHLVISIAMVAVRLQHSDERFSDVALSVGACGPKAVRLPDVEAALIGAPVSAASAIVSEAAVGASLSPIDDHRADARYRSAAAAELLRRAINTLTTPSRRDA